MDEVSSTVIANEAKFKEQMLEGITNGRGANIKVPLVIDEDYLRTLSDKSRERFFEDVKSNLLKIPLPMDRKIHVIENNLMTLGR